MDAEKGINRKLPEWHPEMPPPPEKRARNILEVQINGKDQIMVEGDYVELFEIKEITKSFIINNGDGSCSFCTEGKRSPTLSDNPKVAVVALQHDRGTSYETYVKVQNELAAAYQQLRNALSMEWYNLPLDQLKDRRRVRDVKAAIPLTISEMEPIDLGQ